MGAFILAWGEGPPLENDDAQAGKGLRIGVSQTNGVGLQRDDITAELRMRRYAERRRERRERSGSRWPAEVVK